MIRRIASLLVLAWVFGFAAFVLWLPGVGDDELCDAQVRSNDRQLSCRGCVPSLSKGCGQDEEDPKAAVIELILRAA